MPLFGRSKKRKCESKARNQLSSASVFDFRGFTSPQSTQAPVHQSSQLVLTQTSTWQSPPFHTAQPYNVQLQTQMVPYRYPSAPASTPAHASSPYLPREALYHPPPPRQAQGQHMKSTSCQHLPNTLVRPCQTVDATVNRTTGYLNRGAALYDQVASKFNDVISLMDEETFVGNEQDLRLTYYQSPSSSPPQFAAQLATRSPHSKALVPARRHVASRSDDLPNTTKALTTTNVFMKAAMYANARLPPDLPPLRVYIPTWPLLCLAAQYSLNAYRKPLGAERDAYVDADWRLGTKAMVIKSVPIDDMNTVVFAIRGTQSFMDWAVNLNTATVSPSGFLDDPGNLCHAGFLDVARKMIRPVASRLRQMLEENPSRAACSLVITGHSAGGAVASLLFSHMLSTTTKSELNILIGCFKRVHCVTFGSPPVSLLPLSKPAGQERKLKKSVFLSFINEGDPVTRADKAYIRSLLELYGSLAPKAASRAPGVLSNALISTSKVNITSSFWNNKSNKRPKLPKRPATAPAAIERPFSSVVWPVPPATLSNAGRLVLLRIPLNGRNEDVKALITSDQQLRCVVFGDPLMHQMKLYCRRIEILATKAATGRLMT
jgi:Lipase (class 3)